MGTLHQPEHIWKETHNRHSLRQVETSLVARDTVQSLYSASDIDDETQRAGKAGAGR